MCKLGRTIHIDMDSVRCLSVMVVLLTLSFDLSLAQNCGTNRPCRMQYSDGNKTVNFGQTCNCEHRQCRDSWDNDRVISFYFDYPTPSIKLKLCESSAAVLRNCSKGKYAVVFSYSEKVDQGSVPADLQVKELSCHCKEHGGRVVLAQQTEDRNLKTRFFLCRGDMPECKQNEACIMGGNNDRGLWTRPCLCPKTHACRFGGDGYRCAAP